MNITERQRELACWFGDLRQVLGIDFNVPLGFDNDNKSIGPWLGADWCELFLKELTIFYPFFHFGFSTRFNHVKLSLENWDDNGFNMPCYWHNKKLEESARHNTGSEGSLTERLQEAVRQAIIWLPEESKKVIEQIKGEQ